MCSFCMRLIDSMPPATAIFTSSSITERAATRDCLQARRALPVNRCTGDGDRQSGADRAFARDVHRRGALLHGTSHDDVLNLTRLIAAVAIVVRGHSALTAMPLGRSSPASPSTTMLMPNLAIV